MNFKAVSIVLLSLLGCTYAAEKPCDLDALFEAASGYEYAQHLDTELATEYKEDLKAHHKVCDAEIAEIVNETMQETDESLNLSELTRFIKNLKSDCANEPSSTSRRNCQYAEGIVTYIESHDEKHDFEREFEKAMEMCKDFTEDYWKITKIYKAERDILHLELSDNAENILAKAEICDCINFSSYNRFDMHQKAKTIWNRDHPIEDE